MPGELLIFWSIRAALVCYALVLFGWLKNWQGMEWTNAPWQRAARILWAVGCGLFVLHVLSAFHFHHHWDHGSAYDETARRTEEMFGVKVGVGVYVNHFFMLVWIVDALWWLAAPASYLARGTWIFAALHAWFLFIAFNGAVVFASPPMRYASVVTLAVIFVAWMVKWLRPVAEAELESPHHQADASATRISS